MDIAQLWRRIQTWHDANCPAGTFVLGTGASEEQIAEFQRATGLVLSEDLQASYRLHNGAPHDEYSACWLAHYGEFLSLEQSLTQWKMYRQMESDDGYGQGEDWATEAIEGAIDPLWNPASRMIVTDNSGDHLLIDTLSKVGQPGQVIEHSHEEGPLRVVARSWGVFLRELADALDAGQFAYDAEEETVLPIEQIQEGQDAHAADLQDQSKIDEVDPMNPVAMLEASDSHWRRLLAEAKDNNFGQPLSPSASAGQIGQWVHIHSLDPTLQSSIGEERWIVYRDGDKRPWAVRYDDALRSLLRVARQARDQLGLSRVERWHVVGVVLDRCAVMNEWGSEVLSDVPELVLKALYLPGQVAAFEDPSGTYVVPGYRPVTAASERRPPSSPPTSHVSEPASAAPEPASAAPESPSAVVPSKEQRNRPLIGHPNELLEVLLPILKEANLNDFVEIWRPDASESDRHFQWSQYQQAYHASRGNLKVDRISGSSDLDKAQAQDVVKVFVTRINTDGFETTRPISLLFDGTSWHISSGTI